MAFFRAASFTEPLGSSFAARSFKMAFIVSASVCQSRASWGEQPSRASSHVVRHGCLNGETGEARESQTADDWRRVARGQRVAHPPRHEAMDDRGSRNRFLDICFSKE